MTRKEILLYQLQEIRNEFADALADLTQEQLVAQPMGDHNPIGWIVAHCITVLNFFIYERQTNRSVAADYEEYEKFIKYSHMPPTEENPAPDLTGLADAFDKVWEICVGLIESLDEEALNALAPYWHHKTFESTSSNCVRMINHKNAHLRQIWMIRGALGDKEHWPVQTLYKKSDEEQGKFYVPEREKILEDRRR